MSKIWVMVADASRARLFSAETAVAPLKEIETLAHPEGRLHEGDLVSDKPGRDRNGVTGSHDVGHESRARDEEDERFAIQVCEALEVARNKQRFEKLYVVAAPHFLGLVRKHQSAPLQKLVVKEISKNLVTHSPEEIRKALPDFL